MYLFFDTETTGLPFFRTAPVSDLMNWPRIVQLAWLLYDESGTEKEFRDYIIKPQGFTIPYESERIHGISNERALREGILLRQVLTEFEEVIKKSLIIIAHNIKFDENVLGAEFLRENIKSLLFETKRLCTMKLSTEFCQLPSPYGFKWPTLSELYSVLFDSNFREAHDAALDVRACAKCFFELKRLGIINE